VWRGAPKPAEPAAEEWWLPEVEPYEEALTLTLSWNHEHDDEKQSKIQTAPFCETISC